MKLLFVLCATCCFVAILKLPREYYVFLRPLVSLGAIVAIYNSPEHTNYFRITAFIVILILFNPLFPVYLYIKSSWIPMDIFAGILFLLQAFQNKQLAHRK